MRTVYLVLVLFTVGGVREALHSGCLLQTPTQILGLPAVAVTRSLGTAAAAAAAWSCDLSTAQQVSPTAQEYCHNLHTPTIAGVRHC